MRLDVLLKNLCLVKTRSNARDGILKEKVRVGGRVVKPSIKVKEGDVLQIRYPHRELVIEITRVPEGQVSRKKREEYYRIVRDKPLGG